MNLVVFGASGATGSMIVARALAHWHKVTAFVRDPQKLTLAHDDLRVVQGDVTDPEAVARAIEGQDAVIFAVGSKGLGATTVRATGIQNVLDGMNKAGVTRLIALSALGAGVTKQAMGGLFNLVTGPLLHGRVLADQNAMEAKIRMSRAVWTVVRPASMTNEPAKRDFATSYDGTGLSSTVSREDVVTFVMQQLENKSYERQAVAIAY